MEDGRQNEDNETMSGSDASDTPLRSLGSSGLTGKKFAVPEELIKAGHDTDIPRADSPESLDQDIS